MSKKRRVFSRDLKLQVLSEVQSNKPAAQAAREYEVHPNTIYKWQIQFEKYGERAFAGQGNTYTYEARIAELERKIGQMTMDNELLKKALARLATTRHPANGNGLIR